PVVLGNGTVAIMLALEALVPARGEVIIPSFTFAATANAVAWAGFEPVFADIDPETMTLDPDAVAEVIGPQTVAVMGVHPFGGLCDIEGLDRLATEHGLIVLYDSAQAVGVRRNGRPVGHFGAGESFSLHTTKVLPVGEGGVVTSRDPEAADRIRQTRNFGLGSTKAVNGLNGKITEFSALLGLRALEVLDQHLAVRRRAAAEMKRRLDGVPGLHWQTIRSEVETNVQNLALRIDADAFGLDADEVAAALSHDNIMARRYFNPCLHQLPAFVECRRGDVSQSELVTTQSLCLPIYSDMTDGETAVVAEAMIGLHQHAAAVRARLDTE
ncbi:MAG: aminotransferase class I/II-fold pyridoxal phosphate-dependent enzyme, partial [Actinomycetota bacterium]